MRELDKSFFQKTVPLTAARLRDTKDANGVRTALLKSEALLQINGIKPFRDDPSSPGSKCLLLQPSILASDRSSWPVELLALVDDQRVDVIDYALHLTYDDWSFSNILDATVPQTEELDETPTGFAQVGHVAHLNLRQKYQPYKHLIGQVILDKSNNTKTVISKTLDVGTKSQFRTFDYEVLAGPDDLNVETSEAGCQFKFNFAQVYWNTRLSHEHERLVQKFRKGEAVCDVMAGVGPFAVPAGKKGIFVCANDLNPASYEALQWAIQRNKVSEYVQPFCADGRQFIRTASDMIRHEPFIVYPKIKVSRKLEPAAQERALIDFLAANPPIYRPSTFDHFVMNLPATAIEFLDSFIGLYQTRDREFQPHGDRNLPLIHVHLFQARRESDREESEEIWSRISRYLEFELRNGQKDQELHYVRLVAPNKKMYCATFRLPPEVAFATRKP